MRVAHVIAILTLLLTAVLGFAGQNRVIHQKLPVAVAGGGGAPFAFEGASSIHIASGTANTLSSSMTFTTSANTKLIIVGVGWRRNTGQEPLSVTFNGAEMTYLDDAQGTMGAMLFFLRDPTPSTTKNIVCTMTANTAGFGMAAMSFTGVTTDPDSSSFGTASSVATSTQTRNTTAGDFLVGLLIKQDPTTAVPIKNTAGDTLQKDFTFSVTGNGGFFKMITSTATAATTSTNFSWSGATNRAHCAGVVNP